MRYEIRYGKWGAYFYDKELFWGMPLESVLALLNKDSDIESQFKEVTDRLDHHASIIYKEVESK